jgi:hydroxypyruvate reductase
VLVAAALDAVDASALTRRAAAASAESLAGRRVTLFAAGKAARAMASGCLDVFAAQVTGGLVVGLPHEAEAMPPLEWMASSHPVPDDRSVRAGLAAMDLARSLEDDDVLCVLLSGGASAMLAVPAPGITLDDKRTTTARLLAMGADITSLNMVRKHLSEIKGGRLAAATRARTLAWLLSDVVGNDPSVIGSGPTVADATTFEDALRVLDRFGGRGSYPMTVVQRLEHGAAGRVPDTPKPGAADLMRATTEVIGSALDAVNAAAAMARRLGYQVVLSDWPVTGEARDAARTHAEWLTDQLSRHDGRVCLLSSGETTVTVRGKGIGGRNQEFALALAMAWEDHGRPTVAVSFGTDGVDGPTDAAGARVSRDTIARAHARGLDASLALQANDSWSFFNALGGLMRTGPTGTNVGDVQIVLAAGSESQ